MRAFVNAASVREIIFTRNATESINLVARAWGDANVRKGDEILITGMEHHSNIVPWQHLCERTGATLKVIPIDDRGDLVMEEFERLLTPRTKMLSIVQLSNALGTLNPVAEMAARAKAVGRDGADRRVAGRVPHGRGRARRSALISTRLPATRSTAPRASAFCGDAKRCSTPCRRSSAAAT